MDVTDDPGYNFDAYVKSTKALHIIFIILIVLCNGALIFRIWSQKQFFYSEKYLLLVSLSIGDIFLALYSLVISTRVLFQDFSPGEATCSLLITAGVYQTHLINFVHGIGLVILSAEYIHRCRSNRQRTKTQTDILRGLAISCAPWILGLVIILPLSMAGMDLQTCKWLFSISRVQAVYILSTIVPAVIAFVTAICAACIKKYHVPQQQIELTPHQSQVFSDQSSQWNTQGAPVTDGPTAYSSNYAPAMNNTQVNNVVIGLNPNPHIATTPVVVNNETDKIILLALFFFLLAVPQAVFYLPINLNINVNHNLRHPAEVPYIPQILLMWLMLLRSIFTPLIAIAPSYLQHA